MRGLGCATPDASGEDALARTLILCDCLGSQTVDRDAIGANAELVCTRIHNALCTTQIDDAAKAIADGDAIVACQQERPRFEELAEEIGAPVPDFVDIRDRAGWSDEAEKAGPKQAALVAEALLPPPSARTVDVESEGRCLVIGKTAVALPAAERLSGPLSVTALLIDADDDLPLDRGFEVVAGQLAQASGALGGFRLRIDGLRQVEPGGRGGFALTEPRDGARSECDLIVDLSGGYAAVPGAGEAGGLSARRPGRSQRGRGGGVRGGPDGRHLREAAITCASTRRSARIPARGRRAARNASTRAPPRPSRRPATTWRSIRWSAPAAGHARRSVPRAR